MNLLIMTDSELENERKKLPKYRNNMTEDQITLAEEIYQEQLKRYNIKVEQNKQNGIEYWESQGIKPGDKVERYAGDMLTGGLLGGIRVIGTAKIGKVGAYVNSKFQKGYLSPQGWRKLQEVE